MEVKPIIQLSPLIIKTFLFANVAPKSVKATRNNTLIMEVKTKKYAELLWRTTTLHNMKIKAYPHGSLNISEEKVRSPEVATCAFEQIKQNLKKQLVTDVKRISKKNNQIIDTNTYILTFNSPKPPILKICDITNVDIYIPNPLRCYNCQKFGHHVIRCTRAKICKNFEKDESDHHRSHLPVAEICELPRRTPGWLKILRCVKER